jgi:hypothetical protein
MPTAGRSFEAPPRLRESGSNAPQPARPASEPVGLARLLFSRVSSCLTGKEAISRIGGLAKGPASQSGVFHAGPVFGRQQGNPTRWLYRRGNIRIRGLGSGAPTTRRNRVNWQAVPSAAPRLPHTWSARFVATTWVVWWWKSQRSSVLQTAARTGLPNDAGATSTHRGLAKQCLEGGSRLTPLRTHNFVRLI